MKILKRCTKKRKVRQERDVRFMLDWKQKKVRKSCTDWLRRETQRERCRARKGFEV